MTISTLSESSGKRLGLRYPFKDCTACTPSESRQETKSDKQKREAACARTYEAGRRRPKPAAERIKTATRQDRKETTPLSVLATRPKGRVADRSLGKLFRKPAGTGRATSKKASPPNKKANPSKPPIISPYIKKYLVRLHTDTSNESESKSIPVIGIPVKTIPKKSTLPPACKTKDKVKHKKSAQDAGKRTSYALSS